MGKNKFSYGMFLKIKYCCILIMLLCVWCLCILKENGFDIKYIESYKEKINNKVLLMILRNEDEKLYDFENKMINFFFWMVLILDLDLVFVLKLM